MHIFIIGSLLAIIGFLREKTPKQLFYAVGLMGLTIFFLVPMPDFSLFLRNFVRWSHYLFIIPILLYASYIGIQSKKLDSNVYDVYLWTGLFIIVYHAFKLVKRIMPQPKP
jgi:hypothetical protein